MGLNIKIVEAEALPKHCDSSNDKVDLHQRRHIDEVHLKRISLVWMLLLSFRNISKNSVAQKRALSVTMSYMQSAIEVRMHVHKANITILIRDPDGV